MSLNPNALVTLDEAEAWLRTGAADDPALEEEINRASEAIEAYCARPLTERTHTGRVTGPTGLKLYVKAAPVKIDDLGTKPVVIAVDGVLQTLWLQESDGEPGNKDVSLGSTDPMSATGLRDYFYRGGGWGNYGGRTSAEANVKYTFTAGLAVIPPDLQGACLYVLQKLWRDRQKQVADITTVSGPFGSVNILDIAMPRWAEAALARYRWFGVS